MTDIPFAHDLTEPPFTRPPDGWANRADIDEGYVGNMKA